MNAIPINQEILFAYGEFATRGAAISVLADEIKSVIGTTPLNKGEREAVSMLMLKLPVGSLSVGPYEINWRKVEDKYADLVYIIKG